MNWTQRTDLLIGHEALKILERSHVAVVGLGGVGAYVAEFLVRAGLGHLSLVDGDKVHYTNRNRQLPALCSTEGRSKVEVLAERFLDINPDLCLETFPLFLQEDEAEDFLYGRNRFETTFRASNVEHVFDFVVDAIDSLGSKAALIRACLEHKVPMVSSMGAGGKIDPSQISLCDISKTHHCALARALRHRLGLLGIRKGLTVVFSSEKFPSQVNSETKQTPENLVPGTISFLPAAFACHLAAYTIKHLISGNSRLEKQQE